MASNAQLQEGLAVKTAFLAASHPHAEVLGQLSDVSVRELAQLRYENRVELDIRAKYSGDRTVPEPSGESFVAQARRYGVARGQSRRVEAAAKTLDEIFDLVNAALFPEDKGGFLAKLAPMTTFVVVWARNAIKLRMTSGNDLAKTLSPLIDQLESPGQTLKPASPFNGDVPLGEDAAALQQSGEEGFAQGWQIAPDRVIRAVSELRAALGEEGL